MKSKTRIITALIAVGIMGAGVPAFAQPSGPGSGGCCATGGMGGRANVQPGMFIEQRLARFQADLKLTPAQEPLWQEFAEQARAKAGKGMRAMRDTMQDPSLSAPDRMERRAAAMREQVAAMEATHAKFKRLYDALTPDQKRVADTHAARMGPGAGGQQCAYSGRSGPRGKFAPPPASAN